MLEKRKATTKLETKMEIETKINKTEEVQEVDLSEYVYRIGWSCFIDRDCDRDCNRLIDRKLQSS